ncbi:hypothetical protein [Alkalihalobacterium alkalinitrilicum]|uniref:hypothetical protein n=1 Tax=Alkalihalobacterium alkalinitrilicum TaxID=427920 RepID=UPI0009951110|nr:hypothetical protein [Alkalihalobacterium alkalinitrilicum]
MKLLFGEQNSDITIEVDTIVKGTVNGNIEVLPGARLELEAKVIGNVTLRKHSQISIMNHIEGQLFNEGAKVEFLKY